MLTGFVDGCSALTFRVQNTGVAVLRDVKRAEQARRRGASHVDREGRAASPATERAKPAKGPLFELEIQGGQHNPRFLFVMCSDVVVFLRAFVEKTQKLSRVGIARADDRFRTKRNRCS